ncbi:hypothetical protein [Methylobacterium sp. AMS5]|uniref:hypothetical protein n=1 Tax=Methylobacterium sp. AMS5 TaxID=925818 RepID=UPI00074F9FCF|nr:hypothetical protein [Methylobacterium sp. AMS5]AMB44363.1 hypothetical protein Y590_05595 [Methylobacterium sp. AMS5]
MAHIADHLSVEELGRRARTSADACAARRYQAIWLLAHGRVIVCVDDGNWYDADGGVWRSGRGRVLRRTPDLASVRLNRPILATCHRAHDTSLHGPTDLAAWCQRCHLDHDRPEHVRRRRLTFLRRRALGDLFLGPYPVL